MTAGAAGGGAVPAGEGGGASGAVGAGDGGGATLAQPASNAGSPSAAARCTYDRGMVWIVLEALGALVLLIVIVWWTMFSGRKRGERHEE
jgi:hypothetical protein